MAIIQLIIANSFHKIGKVGMRGVASDYSIADVLIYEQLLFVTEASKLTRMVSPVYTP